jgi:pantoate--beta-alanine ligase
MILFKKAIELHNWLDAQRKMNNTIGFVPTMGALHEGHLSLIKTSKNVRKDSFGENTITVCSIFVNPTQFNQKEDFEKYPVTIEQDIYLLESNKCDVLFFPSVDEIYPDGTKKAMHYDLGRLETILEGKYRPGHFQGVCMVVHRLFDIVDPDRLYLGQKDYQQCMVIARLIDLLNKKDSIQLRICPTQREADGLAMSSRNMRLNEEERKRAVHISKGLAEIKKEISIGNIQELKKNMIHKLEQHGFVVDYVEIAESETLESVDEWNGKQKLVALCAASIGKIRLIDNMLLN